MARVAELDPEYVKRERRREIRFWTSLVIAILAIAGATWAVVVNSEQGDQITRITACEHDAASAACQKVRREGAKAQSLATVCIYFKQAGYPCPKPGSTAAERQARRQGQAGSGSAKELNSGSDGGEAAASGGSGEAPTPGKGGDGSPSAPPKSTGPRHHPSSAPPESGSEGGSAPVEQGGAVQGSEGSASSEESAPSSQEQTTQGLVPRALEGAGEADGGVVEKAEGAMNQVGCAVRSLLSPCP
jgi:hypothetical protein